MKHHIFTIFDAAAEAYLPPFILHAEGMAIRAFTDCINDPNHQFSKHPKDYNLFTVGEFDDQKGLITPLQVQKPLGNGLSFLAQSEDKAQLELIEDSACNQ